VKPTIGLTGGIGSGKSTAAEILAGYGATVVDADDASRDLTGADGAAMPAIRAAFGEALAPPGMPLDRAAMRTLAFADASARTRLEAILHPMVRERLSRELAAATGPYALLVVPLLFESGSYAGRLARVVVVDCSESVQVARTVARSALSPADVGAIMAAQWPRWRRLQSADEVLWNGGDRAGLERQCRGLHGRLCALAGAGGGT
jgi:dephospho-CoA kinase